MSQENTAEKIKMINGTSSSNSYAEFGRRGNIALAVKFYVLADGAMYNAPGYTFVSARLRSCWDHGAQPSQEAPASGDETVVAFPEKLTLDKAWNTDIVWEKVNSDRASTQIGVFIRGNAKDQPEILAKQLEDKKLARDMTGYLFSLLGDESHAVCTRREFADFLHEKIAPPIEGIMKQFEAAKKVVDNVDLIAGKWDTSKALLAKMYQSTTGEEAEDAEDAADSVDPEGDGDSWG